MKVELFRKYDQEHQVFDVDRNAVVAIIDPDEPPILYGRAGEYEIVIYLEEHEVCKIGEWYEETLFAHLT